MQHHMPAKHQQPETAAPGSLMHRISVFLNRDLTSFFRQEEPAVDGATTEVEQSPPEIAAPTEVIIAPLMDAGTLPALVARRKVLDWRDNAHVDIARTLKGLLGGLTAEIDRQLDSMGLFDSLFAQPAYEALRVEIVLRIEKPMCQYLQRQQAELRALATSMASGLKKPLAFSTFTLTAGPDGLVGLDFKPSEREAIVNDLRDWMLGPFGVAADLRNQASTMANTVMREVQTC